MSIIELIEVAMESGNKEELERLLFQWDND